MADEVAGGVADEGAVELEPGTAVVTTGGRGRLRWAVAFVAVIAVVAGLFVLLGGDDDIDADARLAAAQAFLAEGPSYRFDLTDTSRVTTGDPEGTGSETTSRIVTRGEVAAPDRWSVAQDAGDQGGYGTSPLGGLGGASRRLGDQLYVRLDPFSVDGGSSSPPWVQMPVSDDQRPTASSYAAMYAMAEDEEEGEDGFPDGVLDPFDAQWRLEALVSAYLLPVSADPTNVERLVRDAAEPEVEERLAGGGVRLRTTLDPFPEFEEASDEPIPAVTVLLDLDAEDRPVVVRLDTSVEGASRSSEVRFRDWGGDVPVVVPGDDEIDRTPWIAEEDIAELDPSLLVAPTVLPPGMALSRAGVFPGWEDHADGGPCDRLELIYASEEERDRFAGRAEEDLSEEELERLWEEVAFLSIDVSRLGCAVDDDGDVLEAADFTSTFGGRAVLDVDVQDDGHLEVLLGEVVVTISVENLDVALLEPLVASLAPTTVEALGASFPDWVRTTSYYGGFLPPSAPSSAGGSSSSAPDLVGRIEESASEG